MRTFEQRWEEIQQRSIALRRKRKAKQLACTAVCTMVCFGVGLWMAFSAPASVVPSEIHLQDTNAPAAESVPVSPTVKPEYSTHSPTMPEPQLEICHMGEMYLCTDAERLLEIQELLDSVTAAGDFACTEEATTSNSAEVQDDYLADSVPETRLVFTLGDSVTQTYTLEENILTDQKTGGRYVLTPDALLKLNQLIRKDEMP